MNTIEKLLNNIQNITTLFDESKIYNVVNINHLDTDYDAMKRFFEKNDSEFIEMFSDWIDTKIEDIESYLGEKLIEAQKEIFYLFSASFAWFRSEQVSKEGYLSGGFSFNEPTQIIQYPESFWEFSLKQFNKFEQSQSDEVDLIKRLTWFESTLTPREVMPRPHLACLLLEKNKFPSKFYFYSNGLCYELPFTSFTNYINALIASCAVEYWQYFYIAPNIIITKNKGLTYITHDTHRNSSLDERLTDLTYHSDLSYDRLDLIHEHLERCVRLLPSTFPFADFTHHQNYYTRFKELYEASKKE